MRINRSLTDIRKLSLLFVFIGRLVFLLAPSRRIRLRAKHSITERQKDTDFKPNMGFVVVSDIK